MQVVLSTVAALAMVAVASAAEASKVYEIRTYWAPEGKLEDLNARFRKHTLKLFEKHGIENVGYWVPVDNKENKMIYLLGYPSREAASKSWKAFFADPDWQAAQKKSEENGKLVAKVTSVFYEPTDYSPAPKITKSAEPRTFELRTYTAAPGKIETLHARFRDHTVKLFEKHGMENVIYLKPMAGQPGADNTLLYFLAHKSDDARKKSFDAFRNDENWKKALKASEEKAGGSLTAQGGVKSEILVPTDYSPMK
ncbi:MAG TPA: NIPSNAP family protein [Methylomirabilota bacterium]|nr:NIPSNAP family protein [Methylomirabilota bacterium]